MVRVPYGRAPRSLDLEGTSVELLEAPTPPPAPALSPLLERALDAPIGTPPLEVLARHARRVTIIVSDHTRDEPRAALVAAIDRRLPSHASRTLAIATGTHGPSRLEPLGLEHVRSRMALVNHDGRSSADLVELGLTARGTPIVVHRCVVDTDLVIATGCIRPHYFAGFGAGAKAIFPGLGGQSAIRKNHELKREPGATAGNVVDNPCRLDLEEAARAIPVPAFLLNGVVASDDHIHAAVAGDLIAAFRAGASLARHWFTVRARPADLVIASDTLPVTASLYQSAKLAAAAAPLVRAGGRLVLVAECPDGTGPLDVVNEAIFRIGVLPRLAQNVSLELMSSLPDATVERTFLRPLHELGSLPDRTIVLPRASQLIVEALP